MTEKDLKRRQDFYRYREKNVGSISVTTTKDYKALIKAEAERAGVSVNKYILDAISRRMQADKTAREVLGV